MSVTHFNGILNRSFRLFFEVWRSAIPKLKGAVGRINNRWRPSAAKLPVDSLAGRASILPAHGWIVVSGATNGVVFRQTRVEVELFTQ